MLLQLGGQQLKGLGRLHLATGGHHVRHVVEQVKAAHGRGLILQIVAHLQPCLGGAVCVGAGLLKLLLVKLRPGDFLHLADGVVKLAADIGHLRIADGDLVVVGHVNHDERDVVHPGDVLVPLGHAVADVVAAEHKVRHGDPAGLVGRLHPGGIGKGNSGVAADVRVIAQRLRRLAHPLPVVLGADTGGLVLRVDNRQTQRLGDLAGELGRGPAHGAACLLRLPCGGVHLAHHVPKGLRTGAGRLGGLLYGGRLWGGCGGFFVFSHEYILRFS
ncbi:hypothetical protein SDC9_87142 [bioreactor metagenome]|uniref:Uncharacterized protein n=1 Tax=bioreactor metagenome TaxID=1076179 RepID=A0A644ZJJ6_9ZZZZ